MTDSSTKSLEELHKPFPLLRHFYAWIIPALLVITLILSAGLWFAFNHITRSIYLEQSLLRAKNIVEELITHESNAWDTMRSGQASQQEVFALSEVFSEAMTTEKLLKIKVYDLTGKVVYDTNLTTIGTLETGDAFRNTLLNAEPTLVSKTDPDGTAVYEIYTPVFTEDGHMMAIFELYEPVTYLDTLLRKTAVPAISAPILALLLLVLVLGLLVKRGQRALDSRTRTIAELTARLSTFVSSSAISAAMDADSQQDIPSRNITTTLFHSDVRDFTSFAENNTPERVVFFLNDLMSIQVSILQEFGGDVDKMIGDALLVRFTGPDAEIRAIEAAQKILDQVNRTAQPRGLGIGIYTGPVISGAIGPQDRRDFTVIGDSVNMSARLCALADAGELVTDQNTLSASGLDGFSPAEDVNVKGRKQPIAISRWALDP